MMQRTLLDSTLQHCESIAEYAVPLQELYEQIAIGGADILGEQLINFLVKDLSNRL